MTRLTDRVKKLERSAGTDAEGVDCIVLASWMPNGTQEETCRISGYGLSYARLNDESESEFIKRAKCEFRTAGVTDPVLVLFATGKE